MKCENCGRNEANYHYSSNINGKITEKHLCSECAGKLETGSDAFAEISEAFEDMFSGFFGSRSIFGDSVLSPFSGMRLRMPSMMMPRLELRIDDGSLETRKEEKNEKTDAASAAADPELKKRREINMLREQMKTAAEREDFEEAARLRDKLREMEK